MYCRYSESLPAIHVNAGIIHLQNKAGRKTDPGPRTMTLSTSRQQFLACESREPEIHYDRRGGFFVTKCVCCLFVVIALLLSALVGVAAFFLSRYQATLQQSNDLWSDSDATAQPSTNLENLRLPSTVVPSFYRLKLKPDLEKSTFSGEVFITLKTNAQNVKSIVLHSKHLNINSRVVLTEQVYQKIHTIRSRNKRQLSFNASLPSNTSDTETTSEANLTTVDPNSSQIASDKPTEINDENSATPNKEITDTTIKSTEVLDNSTELSGKLEELTLNSTKTNKTVLESNTNDVMNDIPSPPTRIEIVQNTQVTHGNTRNIIVTSMQIDTSLDRLILHLETTLKPEADYTLELVFDGNITDSLTGFYKSSYVDTDKQTKILAVTQFEPVSAREAFPCFDEPEFKATFEISIAHPDNLTALSNMPAASKEPLPDRAGWSWTHFKRSVRMSTYLVAYTVSDFKYLETSYLSSDNVTKPIRVWARAGLVSNAQYAIQIAPKLLAFYEKLFGVPYALDKLDLIAVPDFSNGAMENWGLITFRETTLLYDETTKVARDKQNVAIDVAHELAHQWFGNLVTMRWWTDLWLNEGFATYVEYMGVDHVAPEWGMLDTFTRDKMELLRTDALRHTSPVSRVVADAAEINQKFDEISYAKGASLVRMLNHTVGAELFHAGLVGYLQKWKFSNAVEDDLWAAMGEASAAAPVLGGASLVRFMNTWTRQAGYPVVTARRSYRDSGVVFAQELFTTVKSPSQSRRDQLWSIPVSYTVIGPTLGPWDTAPQFWLNERNQTVNISLNSSVALYVNVDSIGYYRVNYDPANWQLLNVALNANGDVIPPLARAQLLDDAFNLAKVSRLDYKCALDLTTYLEHGEDSRLVWELVLSNLAFLKFTLRSSPYYSDFQDYVLRILRKELEKRHYGLQPPRDDDEAFLIESFLNWECNAESPRCLAWARGEFQNWTMQADPENNPIPSYLRGIVYSIALRYGGRAEFDFLWSVFRNSSDPNVQSSIIGTLASTRDEGLVRLLLERSLSELPNQYAASAWSFESAAGASVAQALFTRQWPRVRDRFARADSFVLAGVISGVFGAISTQGELDTLKRFVEAHEEELRPHMQSILKLVDSATLRINWIAAHADEVGAWLRAFNANGTASTLLHGNNATQSSNETNSTGQTNPSTNASSTVVLTNTTTNATVETRTAADSSATVPAESSSNGTVIETTGSSVVTNDTNVNSTETKVG